MLMNADFKDYFSENSADYGRFRPNYPSALFSYLASISNAHQKAWDCATGTGQAAVSLVEYFSAVIASDASSDQIENTAGRQGISYRIATAENSGIEAKSVDLITVAQAFHWFDIDGFSKEAGRVLKDKGILSIWTYNLLTVQPEIDEIINHLYFTILGKYWPEERRLVEEGYKNVELPFDEINAPAFTMTTEWTLPQLMGYLYTWSATKQYQEKTGIDPIETVQDEIASIWGEPGRVLAVSWPLSLRVWRKNKK